MLGIIAVNANLWYNQFSLNLNCAFSVKVSNSINKLSFNILSIDAHFCGHMKGWGGQKNWYELIVSMDCFNDQSNSVM